MTIGGGYSFASDKVRRLKVDGPMDPNPRAAPNAKFEREEEAGFPKKFWEAKTVSCNRDIDRIAETVDGEVRGGNLGNS